ncbi:MAG: type 4a pilus biogenesis protein PilO [Thermoanaerobaculia bacterium]
MIWREKKWLLIGLGVAFVVNLVFFVTYRLRFEQRVDGFEATLDRTQAQLAGARQQRVAAERELATYRQVVRTVDQVYDQWWATPDERLTPLLVEMRELAKRANLQPPSVSYDIGSERRDGETSTFGISFGVRGTYDDIRRFINLVELSDQFVIIEEIGLADSSGVEGTLHLTIRLRTLFKNEPVRTGASS